MQPPSALPIRAVTKLRFGDVAGYTFLTAVVCGIVSLIAMFLISPTL